MDVLLRFPVASFGAIVLVVLIFVRPQEFVPALEHVPLFNVAFGISVLGAVFETFLGRIRTLWLPLVPITLGWCVWSLFVAMYRLGVGLGYGDWFLSIVYQVLFMAVVLLGSQSFERFRALTTAILMVAIFLSVLMVHQGQCDFQCIVLRDNDGSVDYSVGESDGRPCESISDCEKNAPNKDATYQCERAGLFGSFTTAHGRVRWRGKLSDPNEISLLVASSLAFAFALHRQSRRRGRTLLLLAVTALILYVVVLSQSRGAILIVMAVFGVQFIQRFGFKGLVVAAALGAPLLLAGGRSGSEADESANERLALLYQGIDLVRADPFFGVGVDRFREHVWPPLTAHNSYLLPVAELGLLGQFLWYSMLYVTVKVPLTIALFPPPGMDSRLHSYGVAMATASAGLLVGIFFLSMCYHPLPYIYFGLSGALYGAVRATVPEFRVGFGWKDARFVAVSCAIFLVGMWGYTRYKGMP